MINSQHKTESEIKKVNDELAIVNQALTKIKEAETKLNEIKCRLEYIISAFQDEQRKRKILKTGINFHPIYQFIEMTLLSQVLPVLRQINKSRIDDNQYRRYLQSEKIINSIKTFKDETNAVLKDQNCYQDYRIFSEVFADSEKGLIEFPYELLTGLLEFLAHKEKFLLVRFEKAQDFAELPESFFVCFIRVDLITITLSFKKVTIPTGKTIVPKTDAENSQDEKSRIEGDKVALYNIVYSNLFDRGVEKVDLKMNNIPFYVNWKCASISDADVKNLVEVLRENQESLIFPCIYPSMGIFQRFSCYISERIEKSVKAYWNQIHTKKEAQEELLTQILKYYPDELAESMEGKCLICSNKFAMDSKLQRMLPPLSIKIDNNRKEKKGPIHLACKKMFEPGEADGPQVIIKIDVPDDGDYFS